ncbi:acyl-CoA dehydrogenase family member 10 [Linderina pennispora]|uniref:Acyl-CoA dehydrogenase family member 10 n=1 Tax=Linderina pennispora TaxID=61395 RepID=A0A1Y1WME1_9FUNG|nr:acyl-CoA dehydrogenase family member 10 [Linderina pennispora]ORX74727.1 acyl-CoA dehydrogenase family member 10 [Linderina pennispora]
MSLVQLSPRCIPAEHEAEQALGQGAQRWNTVPPVIERLKKRARELGLWNLFLTKEYKEGPGLTNYESWAAARTFAPVATNCAAPDTGNMEVFAKYGNAEQKKRWLEPLMNGEIRSAFAMTEPAVASSDATNIATSIKQDGDHYVVNGHKWWISGAGHPQCAVFIVMGKSDTSARKHEQQSIIVVPADTPGVTVVRPLTVFGYDDAPHGHCEVRFDNVRVPKENLILGEGRGFERVQSRTTFGRKIVEHGVVLDYIAKSRMELEASRMLVLRAADMIDKVGAKNAKKEIAMAKVTVPNVVLAILDRAIQMYGAGGVGQDTPLASMWAGMRTLRIADGPDEVHIRQIALLEIQEQNAKQSAKL